MTIRLEAKRPDEVRDYRHDWEPFLGTDTIASQVTTATGITLDSVAIEAGDQSVKFWVSGGAEGTPGRIEHKIVTVAGRTESELFVLPICGAEQVTLAEVKAYLRVRHAEEDAKIAAMIPRARLWVEDHTGLALTRREFVERHLPETGGAIRLYRAPLVGAPAVAYVDSLGAAQAYVPRAFAPSRKIIAAADSAWPVLRSGEQFEVTYTAGFDVGEADDRLIGAMMALIEGEYAEGHAYPPRAVEAAERCCVYVRQLFA